MPRNPDAEKDNPCLKVCLTQKDKYCPSIVYFLVSQEQELSYKCLNKNNFNREACEVYFANYKNCKDFWVRYHEYTLRAVLHGMLPKVNVSKFLL